MLVSINYRMEDTILLDRDGKMNKPFRPVIFLVRKLQLLTHCILRNLFYRELFYSRKNDVNTSWSDSAISVSLVGCNFPSFFTRLNIRVPNIPFFSQELTKSIINFDEKPKVTNKVSDFTPVNAFLSFFRVNQIDYTFRREPRLANKASDFSLLNASFSSLSR